MKTKQKETFNPQYIWGHDLAGKEADTKISLYPSMAYAEEIELARKYMQRAMKHGYAIEREHKGRDHYHYYIAGFSVFINENYA
jgi:hypothetical protein